MKSAVPAVTKVVEEHRRVRVHDQRLPQVDLQRACPPESARVLVTREAVVVVEGRGAGVLRWDSAPPCMQNTIYFKNQDKLS